MSEPFAIIHTLDQWYRVSHENTSIDGGSVQLAWLSEEAATADSAQTSVPFAPLGIDPWCRLYRFNPDTTELCRYRWDERHSVELGQSLFDLQPNVFGDFSPLKPSLSPLGDVRDIVVSDEGHLVIADASHHRILIFDVSDKRLLRRLPLNGTPLALCTVGSTILCVLQLYDGSMELVSLTAQSIAVRVPIQEPLRSPVRLSATPSGELLLLEGAARDDARVALLSLDNGSLTNWLMVESASDIIMDDGVLVVARNAGADFLRFQISDWVELPHLNARHYRGDGIVRTPQGQIAFWTNNGFELATLARLKYVPEGRLVSFRLDSGQFQTRWGQVYVDACIPQGCSITFQVITADEVPDSPKVAARLPANVLGNVPLLRPDLAPLPPLQWVDGISTPRTLHRRRRGNESEWHCPADGAAATYEAPIIAAPGRYLWIVMTLRGKTRVTPKVSSVRVQYPCQDLLRRLPRHFSEDEAVGSFLARYLGITHTGLVELDRLAQHRHVLLDPDASPESFLPWLGNLLGLEIDHRWSESAQRRIIKQAMWLYRYRGTVAGIKRFIELYIGREVVLVEHFKVRGLGGAFLGTDDALAANAIVGSGLRVGGQVGSAETQSVGGVSIEDAITTHAHRFTVLVPLMLDAEQRSVIEHILEVHRPAHTVFDMCSIDSGMRVGTGLHLGISSMVGVTSGFGELQVGHSVLGRVDVIGRAPVGGVAVGSDSVGITARLS